jgi:phage tail sheath protein FI
VRVVSPSAEIDAPAGTFDLEVWAPVDNSGELAAVERRTALSLDPNSARFVETAVNVGIDGEFGASEYITIDALVAGGTVTTGDYVLATSGGPNVDGLNLAASDIIGSFSSQSATGLKALRNPETVDFNLVAVPGVTHRDVINEVIDLCESRGDCFAIIDTPFGLSAQQVVAWHNGTSGLANAPTVAINSSYAAIFWSWVKEYDPYTKKTLWLPPSGFAAQAFAFNDANGGPWKIPAGPNRGLITGQDLEVKPDIDTRRLLQATGSNRINPIISKLDTGLQLYGNRTTQRRASALENIHTRRMLIYAEKLIATATQYLVFEPNTATTWRAFENLVRPILAQIKANEGLERFDVTSNESTNPPAQRQQQKLMRGRIRIAAVEGAEAIEVEFNLFATGASFADA